MNFYKLIEGDCLEILPTIETESVNMILCDLPYGVTQNPNDNALPLKELWIQYKRVIKNNGAVVLTSQFPFTFDLIQSNRDWFRYDLIWDKVIPVGFLNANRMPLRAHEHILIFYNKLPTFNPQFSKGPKIHGGNSGDYQNRNYGDYTQLKKNPEQYGTNKFPKSIIKFVKPNADKCLHPTQKPVKLFEYLIKSYSNENDVVLDNCAGSGTTISACQKTRRNCIAIEINPNYCSIIRNRCFGKQFLDREVTYEMFVGGKQT